MKSAVSTFLRSTLLAAGLSGISAGAAHAQSAGALALPHAEPLRAEAGIRAEPVDHRHWRRHHRRHGSGGSIQFNFGNGSVWIDVPPPQRRYHRRYYRRDAQSLHVEWCYDRYRSYRHWDNTFQPYHGPRRQCYSPYY